MPSNDAHAPQDGISVLSEGDKKKPASFKRGYVACMRCRARKVKCVLDSEPPCAKCRRELRECRFKSDRKSPRHREPPKWSKDQSSAATCMTGVSVTTTAAVATTPASKSPTVNDVATSPRFSLMERAMSSLVPKDTLFDDAGGGEEDNNAVNPETKTLDTITQRPHLLTSSANESVHVHTSPEKFPLGPRVIVSRLSNPSYETLRLWSRYGLVRQRWLTAQEAVTYLDLFFEHLAPLSPVLISQYMDHRTHRQLIFEEPMLCSTILVIASRFFVLPGSGGVVRGHFIHERLWKRTIRLLEQIVFGQPPSNKESSFIGVVESCLLISDWHPRSINFPAEQEELDLELDEAPTADELRYLDRSDNNLEPHLLRWQDDVIEPSKRSDHMSWMLLGIATTLVSKMSLFSDDPGTNSHSDRDKIRIFRVRKLLYVYVTNISVRLGCTSNLPQDSTLASPNVVDSFKEPIHERWEFFMDSWLDLVRLIKTASAMFFESVSFTKKQLLNGQYVVLLTHFAPSLERWRIDFEAGSAGLADPLKDLLYIEYQNLRVYTHGLSMQAIVERALRQGLQKPDKSQNNINSRCFLPADHGFLQEVVAGSSEILRTATNMALSGRLHYMPGRQSLCIISATIFLLKAVSIGGVKIDLESPLAVLDQCITALRSSPIDDMDFSSRFATLIQKRVAAFRASFKLSTDHDNNQNVENNHSGEEQAVAIDNLSDVRRGRLPLETPSASNYDEVGMSPDTRDWWNRPFDPTIAPFSSSGNHIFGLELNSLDFLWNMPDT